MNNKNDGKRVIDMTEQTINGRLQNYDLDRNKVFFCRAIQNVLQNLLASILQDITKVCNISKAEVVQVAGASTLAIMYHINGS